MLSTVDLKNFQKILEDSITNVILVHHKQYMEQYLRFRKMNGPQCPFCKAAAKYIYAAEIKRNGADFLRRVKTNQWDGYE